MTALVATDLDGTVLFTVRQPEPEPCVVPAGGVPPAGGAEGMGGVALVGGAEGMGVVSAGGTVRTAGLVPVDGTACGYMTAAAAAGWSRLAGADLVVPVTTRSVPQYLRLALPGRPPRYAIVSNGACLLVDGVVDARWHRTVTCQIAATAAGFQQVWDKAVGWHADYGFKLVRAVEEFFIYLTVVRREPWLEQLAAEVQVWAEANGWRASLQGRKLYLVPAALDKSVAVAHLAARVGADQVFAGGDSLLDAEMLRRADAAIRPSHGELHLVGFTAQHCQVTVESGIAAGDEIISWYARRCGLADA